MEQIIAPGKILSTINSPNDLKKLSEDELVRLCEEIRHFIIDVVSHHPGHLGASLGVVELTVALHYIFNAPKDKLVWDVGHQAYAHKIITGRRDVFHTNRKYKGISGFPKMSESVYDAFGVGHSSTSISAALGMAIAAQLKGDKETQHVAIIGDGSMTGGMAFEALNNAGVTKTNILVVLNDNGIAIDENVGALKEYLTDITTSQTYNKIKDEIWNLLGMISKYAPNARTLVQKVENAIKLTLFRNSNYFESLGFRYFGPIDGHDLNRLVKIFADLKNIPGPKLLHCITVKGKGFLKAEENQTKYHNPGHFDKITGDIISQQHAELHPPKYQDVFGKTLLTLAKSNPLIVGITPAMATGCSMTFMMEELPERTFDVGIAEQHAVTFSAGLATQGFIPFCNIYSTFFQRAYDQLIHDVAIQKLPVIFCLDRAGLVGDDGATHHGAFDIAYLRCIPNLIIAAPMNEIELRNLMFTAQLKKSGPFVIRYPRGNGVFVDWEKEFTEIPVGTAKWLSDGVEIAVISIGHTGNFVVEAIKMLPANQKPAHIDLRFVKPMDEEVLHRVFKDYKKVLVVEDGVIKGGAGSAIIEFMMENKYKAEIRCLGIPDRFVEQGSLQELYDECGYSTNHIYKAICKWLEEN